MMNSMMMGGGGAAGMAAMGGGGMMGMGGGMMSMGGGGMMGMGGGMMGMQGGMMAMGGGGMMGMGGGMMMGMGGGGMMGMGGGMMMGMGGGMQMGGMMMGGMMMGGMQGMMPGMMPGGGMMMGGGMMGGGGMQMMGCHPGCFPAGTLVQTSGCPRRIETIKVGEFVLGVDKKGKTVAAKVHSAFVTDNYLVEVETDSGRLITTGQQPLCLACGCTKTANELVPGDEMLSWEDGERRPTKVRAINKTGQLVQVFNLVLEDQDFYISGGFQVRSKPPFADVASIAVVPEIDALPSESTRE